MAGAAPVTVTTAVRAGGIVTVTTAAAHGLVANQGFQLAGVADAGFNGNSTVVSAADATHFTFRQAGPNASSTGGQVAPAKQVIILDAQDSGPAQIAVHYLSWLTTAMPMPRSGGKSAWAGASAAENAAIAAGTTIEKDHSDTIPGVMTPGQVAARLQLSYQTEQAQYAALVTQPGAFAGNWFDGAGWST